MRSHAESSLRSTHALCAPGALFTFREPRLLRAAASPPGPALSFELCSFYLFKLASFLSLSSLSNLNSNLFRGFLFLSSFPSAFLTSFKKNIVLVKPIFKTFTPMMPQIRCSKANSVPLPLRLTCLTPL
mmetsp:Transcript_4103/g.7240  ORF Transcript_4103/g.7240 Transcript_4103/m.7240 type:complete len:129 (-) Transcript_4103:263-649(-)